MFDFLKKKKEKAVDPLLEPFTQKGYDHSKTTFIQALGIPRERHDALINFLKKNNGKYIKNSMIFEMIETARGFTLREKLMMVVLVCDHIPEFLERISTKERPDKVITAHGFDDLCRQLEKLKKELEGDMFKDEE